MKTKYLLSCIISGLLCGFIAYQCFLYFNGSGLPQGTYQSSMIMKIERNGRHFTLPVESRIEINDEQFNLLFITDGDSGFSSTGTVEKDADSIRFIHAQRHLIAPEKAATVLEQTLIRPGSLSGKLRLQVIDQHSFAIIGESIALYYTSKNQPDEPD
ncbi:hypothetical protein [Psychromonas ossibalaenae]|uniref:hypothetical protein n=1 Tax=Psychromonas ossibalaenae TaxID=444922 RepID=UPI000380BB05|nr:hypothetical protein [Psychromonas ossibalaenae]